VADSDFETIVRLLTRYARALDTRDWDLYETVFAPEAVIDYTSSGGVRAGRAEARVWVAGAMEPFTMSQHLMVNHDIRVDGDTATAHTDLYNPLGRPDGKGGLRILFVGGVYKDKLRRTGDGWVITERIEQMTWWTGDWPEDVVLDS
jgi:hypothetical protein